MWKASAQSGLPLDTAHIQSIDSLALHIRESFQIYKTGIFDSGIEGELCRVPLLIQFVEWGLRIAWGNAAQLTKQTMLIGQGILAFRWGSPQRRIFQHLPFKQPQIVWNNKAPGPLEQSDQLGEIQSKSCKVELLIIDRH